MKLDILAIAAHPDDVELSCAGTLLKEISSGKKAGVLDLTQGELGTRGSAAMRLQEAEESARILGLSCRDNLGFQDGFFQNDQAHQRAIIQIIRKYQPDIVFANALSDRHPDHGRAAKLAADACFYSGLRKIESRMGGVEQAAWRPKAIYHYVQDYFIVPDLVVNVTPFVDQKMQAIKAFSSQFYRENSNEPESPLTGKHFFDYLKSRMMDMGRYIQVDYAEGFCLHRPAGVQSFSDLT